MKYPSLTLDQVERLSAELLAGREIDLANEVKWVGSGSELDVDDLEDLEAEVERRLGEFMASGNKDKDSLEAELSGVIHRELQVLPLGVLDDPGFWRYLTVAHLWQFTVWREEKAFGKGWQEHRSYCDGQKSSECVPLRMFIRGQVAERDGDYGLTGAGGEATDFWRSHVVRVRTSYARPIAQALSAMQGDQATRLTTDPLRELAKRLQRISSNVALLSYDEQAAAGLVQELREGMEGWEKPSR